jgi:hypothetical protein
VCPETEFAVMNETYDIFQHLAGTGPIWIEVVHGLDNARKRLAELLVARPGNYFIFDPRAAKVIFRTLQAA